MAAQKSSKKASAKGGVEQVLVITRVFDAARKHVFRAWTDPKRLVRWWGPKGFTTPVYHSDFRPGGVYRSCMRSPDGKDYWSTGVYREIVEPTRFVCTDSFSDAEGNVVPASEYGMGSEWPLEMLLTVTFDEIKGKTTVTLRHELGSAPAKDAEMCRQGWSESLDKLAEELAKP